MAAEEMAMVMVGKSHQLAGSAKKRATRPRIVLRELALAADYGRRRVYARLGMIACMNTRLLKRVLITAVLLLLLHKISECLESQRG